MSSRNDVIETTAGQVAAELSRRGIAPERLVSVTIEPEDWLTRARRESASKFDTAGRTDEDIDRLIEDARKEANEEIRRKAKPKI